MASESWFCVFLTVWCYLLLMYYDCLLVLFGLLCSGSGPVLRNERRLSSA